MPALPSDPYHRHTNALESIGGQGTALTGPSVV